jgi:hypothetical protein
MLARLSNCLFTCCFGSLHRAHTGVVSMEDILDGYAATTDSSRSGMVNKLSHRSSSERGQQVEYIASGAIHISAGFIDCPISKICA